METAGGVYWTRRGGGGRGATMSPCGCSLTAGALLVMLGVIQMLNPTHAQFMVEILEPGHMSIRRPVQRCEAAGASFGGDIFTFSVRPDSFGCAFMAKPNDGCSKIEFIPPANLTHCKNSYFAVVPRGKCNYSRKAYFVQESSPVRFTALIVYNDKGKPPVEMRGGEFAEKVHIPVLMVSWRCMELMMDTYPAEDMYTVHMKMSDGYYDLIRYLVPFVVVVGFCFIVLVASMGIRICRDRRRQARKRLSKRNLRKIPTRKFQRGDHPETCAICLDDFVDGEKLRVLPCRHTYHCKCIDPWLTQNRKTCPMCKRRVGAKNSDSESSADEAPRRANENTSGSQMSVRTEESLVSRQFDDNVTPPPSPGSMASVGPGSSMRVNVEMHSTGELGDPGRGGGHLSGSREQLVDDDSAQLYPANSDDERRSQNTLSQSLKKLKGFFKPGKRNADESSASVAGQVNSGFEHRGSIASTEQVDETVATSTAQSPQRGNSSDGDVEAEREVTGRRTERRRHSKRHRDRYSSLGSSAPDSHPDRFRDPFEDHPAAIPDTGRTDVEQSTRSDEV